MNSKVVDLTHLLNEGITVYPGTLEPKFTPSNTIEKDGFAELVMTMCSHTGTHMDAPAHMIEGAKSLDQLPADRFVGEAIVIPCKGLSEISLDHIKPYEHQIAKVKFVIFYTGWQERWNTSSYFNNFPVLTQDAAKWLTRFNLSGVGYDAISADTVMSIEQPNHKILLGKDFVIVENLTNVDHLPEGIFTLVCLPLKIENADGSPIRAIAIC